MSARTMELHGYAFIDGRIVVVGKATQEKDHGKPFWLCSTTPPRAQRFEPVQQQHDAVQWLKREAGADSVFLGAEAE